MPALIYEITQAHNIMAAIGNKSKIQIPEIKISKITWIKVRLAFQLLDPTSISNPFRETPHSPQQKTRVSFS